MTPEPTIDADTNLVGCYSTLALAGIDPLSRSALAVSVIRRSVPHRSYGWCKEVVDELNTRGLYRHMVLTGQNPRDTAAAYRVPADHPALLVAVLRMDLDHGRLAS